MQKYTVTQLRSNIYKILDSILQTGEPIEIIREGHILKITIDEPINRLKKIKRMPGLIVKDSATLDQIEWSEEWKF